MNDKSVDDLIFELGTEEGLPEWKIEMLRAVMNMDRPKVLMPRQYRNMLREVDE